jgi:hypothetical protein
MSMLDQLFGALWRDYLVMTPVAARVHELLTARGETILNDHIAMRTFDLDGIGIESLDRAFVTAGYEPVENYEFPDKHLAATHYEHPIRDAAKVFISALLVDELSAGAADTIRQLASQVPAGAAAKSLFACSGRHWEIDYATYETLAAESEYAAWMAAFGFRANHFTVDVNALTTFDTLADLNAFLIENDIALSDSGGVIKGGPDVLLEQSSTIADEIDVELADGTHRLRSCYYEFARRYPTDSGELFQGFVPQSAARLFESTDRNPRVVDSK